MRSSAGVRGLPPARWPRSECGGWGSPGPEEPLGGSGILRGTGWGLGEGGAAAARGSGCAGRRGWDSPPRSGGAGRPWPAPVRVTGAAGLRPPARARARRCRHSSRAAPRGGARARLEWRGGAVGSPQRRRGPRPGPGFTAPRSQPSLWAREPPPSPRLSSGVSRGRAGQPAPPSRGCRGPPGAGGRALPVEGPVVSTLRSRLRPTSPGFSVHFVPWLFHK